MFLFQTLCLAITTVTPTTTAVTYRINIFQNFDLNQETSKQSTQWKLL